MDILDEKQIILEKQILLKTNTFKKNKYRKNEKIPEKANMLTPVFLCYLTGPSSGSKPHSINKELVRPTSLLLCME